MYRLWNLLLLAAIALVSACDQQTPTTPGTQEQPAPDSPAAAEVNGSPISQAMLDAYLQARGIQAPTREQRESALDDLIKLVLLQQQAEKSGLTNDPQLQAALRLERVNSVASAMAREYASAHPVTEAEAMARYQSGLQQAGTTEFQVRHILLPTREQAQAAIAQLNEGADFAQLADQLSGDQGADPGGSLGWLNPAQMPPPMAEAVKSTSAGSYSQTPVQTPFGWHIVMVENTREFTPPSFDQVKSGIVTTMQRERMQQYVTGLRAGAQVEIKANLAAPAPQGINSSANEEGQ